MTKKKDGANSVRSNDLFAYFGPFRYRFESLYKASGRFRRLINKNRLTDPNWLNDLEKEILAIKDAVTVL